MVAELKAGGLYYWNNAPRRNSRRDIYFFSIYSDDRRTQMLDYLPFKEPFTVIDKIEPVAYKILMPSGMTGWVMVPTCCLSMFGRKLSQPKPRVKVPYTGPHTKEGGKKTVV